MQLFEVQAKRLKAMYEYAYAQGYPETVVTLHLHVSSSRLPCKEDHHTGNDTNSTCWVTQKTGSLLTEQRCADWEP